MRSLKEHKNTFKKNIFILITYIILYYENIVICFNYDERTCLKIRKQKNVITAITRIIEQ